ncbi:unnamed protein product [Soboliphyme baturini]|uniref:Ubiquitin-like modifier-activating enzyme ATG7 n=1 Tax=Soboliphyme baturini TaxID=241478 RepID=A0A183IBW4_9BILA|nr:unnamed protein product [Soboliphyme baturini]
MAKEVLTLQFVPFCSFIDPAFWYSLSKLKLESLRLDESPVPAWGFFANCTLDKYPGSNTFISHGTVHVLNTLDKFKEIDKNAIIDSVGKMLLISFCDPSNQSDRPGWPLRNLLALWKNRLDCNHSLVLDVAYDRPEECTGDEGTHVLDNIKTVGWEKDKFGRFSSQHVDLSSAMDPKKLSEEAVRLNLHLMRWRLVPELNLDIVKDNSCLLFGAGTLGCNVARLLSAWGCNKISFIDDACVSYSNPVRQSLYLNEDCADRKPKCDAAVAAMKAICPNIVSHFAVLTMLLATTSPFHHLVTLWTETLDELVQSHDVLFLLFDTREARWLPAMLGCYYNKIVITVALGFDNYLVMRHGLGGFDLACYFCCDITAPGDSTKGRTLDQQCSVTRPGLSSVAAGNAVELMVSILQHPLKGAAPTAGADNDGNACLGIVPHQIRGYLNRFEQNLHSVERYSACIACSSSVIDRFSKEKTQFVMKVLNEPSLLEEITGLDMLKQTVNYEDLLEINDTDENDDSDQDYVLACSDI